MAPRPGANLLAEAEAGQKNKSMARLLVLCNLQKTAGQGERGGAPGEGNPCEGRGIATVERGAWHTTRLI